MLFTPQAQSSVLGAMPTARPLSYDVFPRSFAPSFIELYKKQPYSIWEILPTAIVTERKKLYTGAPNLRRTGPQIINKFTKHGLKARAQRAYGKGLANLHALYLNKATIQQAQLLVGRAALITNQSCAIRLQKQIRMQVVYLARVSKYVSKFGLALSTRFDWESTYATYDIMARWAPVRAVVINRVSKQIYKSTRGRTGRYSATIMHISKTRKFQYMQTYYKYMFRFSKYSTFSGKFFDVLYSIVVEPKTSLGYLYGRASGDLITKA